MFVINSFDIYSYFLVSQKHLRLFERDENKEETTRNFFVL